MSFIYICEPTRTWGGGFQRNLVNYHNLQGFGWKKSFIIFLTSKVIMKKIIVKLSEMGVELNDYKWIWKQWRQWLIG